MKKKGFTLIELLAVLVVLAIIALITIPIVLGIINRARIKSAEASIRGYADALEKSYSEWLIDNPNGTFNDFNYNSVDYKGNTVTCDDVNYNNGNIELECCSVGNSTNNYYSYKNSSVTHYNVCPSRKEYQIGDTFTLNGDSYHVIANSPTTQDYVVALKDKPLTVSELESAGATYVVDYGEERGYIGGVVFGSSSTYETSDIKLVVEAWAAVKFNQGELKTLDRYSARLLKYNEDLLSNLGYNPEISHAGNPLVNFNVPSWVYNQQYSYWIMDSYKGSASGVWGVGYGGSLGYYDVDSVGNGSGAVRPVINVYKNKIPQ